MCFIVQAFLLLRGSLLRPDRDMQSRIQTRVTSGPGNPTGPKDPDSALTQVPSEHPAGVQWYWWGTALG